MELRHYFQIVRRSWALVLGLPALVALLTVGLAFVLPPTYEITAALLVTQRPIAGPPETVTLPDYNLFHSWAASEYIVDDIPQIVETERFAADVAAWVGERYGRTIDPRDVSGGLEAERQHRMVYLQVSARQPDEARMIAQGASAMLRDKGLMYWNRDETTSLDVSELELPAKAEPAQGPIRLLLDVALRSILAGLLAIGLAFLRHYLDQSVHGRGEVEALGLEVVGTIPAGRGRQAVPPVEARPPRTPLRAARRP